MNVNPNLEEPSGGPDPAYWERLDALVRIIEGGTALHLSPDDSQLPGIYLWMSTYALDRFKERYIVVHKYIHYIAVSLETFTVLDSDDLVEFIAEDREQCASLEQVVEYLAKNADQFRRGFDHYALGLSIEGHHAIEKDPVCL